MNNHFNKQKSIGAAYDDLRKVCDGNGYTLEYLQAMARAKGTIVKDIGGGRKSEESVGDGEEVLSSSSSSASAVSNGGANGKSKEHDEDDDDDEDEEGAWVVEGLTSTW